MPARKRLLGLLVGLLVAVCVPAPAAATVLHDAVVKAVVAPDGSLYVSEQIAMSDVFHGAYRDIPLRKGESIDRIAVYEQADLYTVGGSAELGSIGSPSTYATKRIGSTERIVWHFDNPSGGVRTFTVSYRFRGLVIAYDDVVDVYPQVWGSNWNVSLPSLSASMRLPRKKMSSSYRVWGMPVYVHGNVERRPGEALLQASSVSPGQFVEMRVVFPRSFLTSTGGAQVRSGPGLERIVAQQKASYRAYDRDRRRIHDALVHWKRTLAILFALAFLPAVLVTALVYGFFGRDRSKGYDRTYEQEPPSDLSPALASALLRQRANAGASEFTATLFDLIRRGHYKAAHVTSEHSTWAGLHHADVADLELSKGKPVADLTPWELAVVEVTDDVLGKEGSERLSRFHTRIAAERATSAERFKRFTTSVSDEIDKQSWYDNRGLAVLITSCALFLAADALLFFYGVQTFRTLAPQYKSVAAIVLGVCAGFDALIVGVALAKVPLWRSRKKSVELEGQRWRAFRHYLNDFPRLKEAPPSSVALWERYLVYGIAFGIAERVLQGAQIHMPQELHDQSSLYWISPNSDLGSGASALGISNLTSGFGSAFTPPSSGSSGGFGGGFGGGGGGGGGGW